MTGEPLMAQDLLETLVGDWEGVYNLWLEPGTLRGESAVRATIRSVLKGRYVVHDYEWADQGAPQQGTMLLGQDGESVWQMAWVDTWRTGRSIMSCTGAASPEATGLGSYDSGDEALGLAHYLGDAGPRPSRRHRMECLAWGQGRQGDRDDVRAPRIVRVCVP